MRDAAFEQVEEAADLGGAIHAALELAMDGWRCPRGRPSFRLQVRTSLGGGDWENVGRHSVTGAVTTVVATNAAPACFYRAVAP